MVAGFAESPEAVPGPARLPRRDAARVVLLDPGNRVLLMRYDDGPPNGIHWATPGGGLEPGESYRQAALRELAEETGWADVILLKEIYQDRRAMVAAGRLVDQHERFYLARTGEPARQVSGVEAMHESDGIAAWRWWTADELAASPDPIWPAALAGLIRSELGDG